MAGISSLSHLVLFFVLICLISFAGFIYLTSSRHPEQTGKIATADSHKLYNDLASYVQTLEDAILRKEKQLLGMGNTQENVVGDHSLSKNGRLESAHTGAEQSHGHTQHPISVKPEMLSDAVTTEWVAKLSSKLLCLRLKKGGIYLYHTRKAAGTSIRDVLTYIAREWHVPYYETEGIVLNSDIIKKSGLLSVTSLREPIARIMSLYWYEHVGWYSGVLKQTERCKTLKAWVAAWRDGSEWKNNFIAKNPDSVYVEIENYYVKMLSGWHARPDNVHNNNMRGSGQHGVPKRVTEEDLEIAKSVLRQFDLVLLSDWMNDNTQIEALNAIFPGMLHIMYIMCV